MTDVNIQSGRTVDGRHVNWLAPVGTVMAMIACYGMTAAIGILSLIGMSVALPFRAPFIILFAGIATAGLAGSYSRHRSRLVLALGLVGFILIAGSKFLPPGLTAAALGIEAAGFICMVAGNVLAFQARRRGDRACAVRRAG